MKPLALYIHWPFCLSKCPYCDFNSHVQDKIEPLDWLNSYLKEIDHFQDLISNREVSSIFFGGGTPSLMEPWLVDKILDHISKISVITDSTEITLEANPNSSEVKKFQLFKNAGINRLSIGIQALNDKDLKALGRTHNSQSGISAIHAANSVFSRVSFDLIYTRQNQTLEDWKTELEIASTLFSGHMSLYQLTIEKGTPFYKLFNNGELVLPKEETSIAMYEYTNQYMLGLGYNRYEISNYSKPGQECRHNLSYWHYDEYLGIGPGAHSRLHHKDGVQTIVMHHKPEKWLSCVQTLGHGIQTKTYLTPYEVASEALMMGLRLEAGIKFEQIRNFHDFIDMTMINKYSSLGLIDLSDTGIKLLPKGLLLHNYIVPRILQSDVLS